MKKSFIIPLALVGLLTASCNFLNVDDYFEDTFSEERIFESQYNIERYFNGAVNQLPKEGRIYYWCSVPGATGSDEAVSCGTFYNGILDVSFPGTELTTDKITYTETGGWDWNFNVWPNCYKVIRKVNTILPHIDEVPDMNAFDKMEFRARARFLRAYAYYWILQNQGPMIDPQIINGGQTTASLANAKIKKEVKDGGMDNLFVPMKLTVLNVDDDMSEDDIERYNNITKTISQCANSQNAVSEADFFSNHPYHVIMEQ